MNTPQACVCRAYTEQTSQCKVELAGLCVASLQSKGSHAGEFKRSRTMARMVNGYASVQKDSYLRLQLAFAHPSKLSPAGGGRGGVDLTWRQATQHWERPCSLRSLLLEVEGPDILISTGRLAEAHKCIIGRGKWRSSTLLGCVLTISTSQLMYGQRTVIMMAVDWRRYAKATALVLVNFAMPISCHHSFGMPRWACQFAMGMALDTSWLTPWPSRGSFRLTKNGNIFPEASKVYRVICKVSIV